MKTDKPFIIPPTVMREMLKRVAAGRQKARRNFWRRAAQRVHTARIGSETIESNLPLPCPK